MLTATYRETIESRLTELIPELPVPQSELFTAARYSLLSSGKRLRPLLTLLATEVLGGSIESALNPACAIELIHTYSLIHDDLPCMDDDDLRRGRPTLHKVYNDGHAVLTGDYLLTYAFQVLAESPHLSSDKKNELILLLAKASGGHGMIGGQVVDIAMKGKTMQPDLIHFLHLHKTAALIQVSVEFGAVIGEASPADFAALKNFGMCLGLAYQYFDDIQDASASDGTNAAILLGLGATKQLADELYQSARESLERLSRPAHPLINLCDQLLQPKL